MATGLRQEGRRVSLRRSGGGWLLGALLAAALTTLPVLALAFEALSGSGELWPHLLAHVIPHAAGQTGLLLAGVGVMTAALGCSTAWLAASCIFPGRRIFQWALLLPLATPTYIIAYVYMDLLHPVGPAQSALRALLGYASPRDFRLPDIRSLGGCIVLLGFVLYPYVYLTTRAMFLTQAANLMEASRTLGLSATQAFWRVALPLARPAVAVGVALALMETLNDVGASEFLGVNTLTLSIYSTWLNRSDLAGAAQIALVMLTLVVALIACERWARRRQRYWASPQRNRPISPRRLGRVAGLCAMAWCALPVLIGFVIPASYLVEEAWKRYSFAGISTELLHETATTIALASAATAITLIAGVTVAYAARSRPGGFTAILVRLASLGYAMPGAVVAIGVLVPTAAFDRLLDQTSQAWFGVSVGLLLVGSGAALCYAYAVRFLAITVGSADAGFDRIPQSLDHAARSLGQTLTGAFWRVHLPLSAGALASAGLLVFVDVMKELPVTLLLRPLNVETLATHLYGEAARGTYEEAAIAALAIVAAGIAPVIVLARIGQRDGA